MSQTLHQIPAATITHTTVVLYGEIACDIAVHHARTTDARIGLTFGTTLMNLYSASAAQGLLEAFGAAKALMARVPRKISGPTAPPYDDFARTTVAIEWTRRPAYCAVPQSGPHKSTGTTTHWVDLYCGPITFQLRDHLGLTSALALMTRTHKTATAVFLDGPQHADNPNTQHYRGPR